MLYPGCTVSPYYDSLLAKLIVWDEDRGAALSRLSRALDEVELEGVHSTLALHRALAQDRVVAGDYHELAGSLDAGGSGGAAMSVRYTHGGDEFIFAEISEDMSLESLQGHGHHPRCASARSTA